MKFFKFVLLPFLFFTVFVFESANAKANARKFNFFFYINATEPYVENYQLAQIEALKKTRKRNNANYFVLIKQSNGITTRFMLNELGLTNQENPTIEDISDWRQIAQFVQWGNSISQASKNIMVFNSHGSFYGSTNESIFNDDLTSGKSTSIHEFIFALEYIKRELGKSIDVLVFDACYMSAIEVQSQAYGYANYFVAGAIEISEVGLDYGALSRLVAADANINSLTPGDLALFIQNMKVTLKKGNVRGSKTQEKDPEAWPMSAYNLNLLPPFIESLNNYIQLLLGEHESVKNQVKKYISDNPKTCKDDFASRLTPGQSAETPVSDRIIVSSVIQLGAILTCLNPENFGAENSLKMAYKEMMDSFKKYNGLRKQKSSIDFLESKKKIINYGVSVIFHPYTFNNKDALSHYQRLRFDYFSNWSKLGLFLTSP